MNERSLEHGEISTRAYFIYREEDEEDDVANWLRAERELATGDDLERERSVRTDPTPGTGEIDLSGSG